MKKFLLFCFMLLTMGISGFSQEVIVGTGTTTSYTSPFNNLYKNSWDECIYLASEIQTPGTITSIAYDYGGTATSSYVYTTLKVYMGTTTRSNMSSTTDWTSDNDLTLVYDGTNITNPTTQGWFEIELDNPFFYNGTDNLVVVVSKTVSSYNSAFTYRYTSTSSNYLCMYRQSDSDLSYAQHPGSATGTRTYNRANIKLTMGNVACRPPKRPTISNVTANSAEFSWSVGDHESDWEVYISDNDIPDENTVGTAVTDTFYTFYNLNPNTQYTAYVRANCLDSNANSNWASKSFTTACVAIDQLPFQEDFDSYGTGESSYPNCWTKINTYSSNRPYCNSSNHYDGVASLYFYCSSTTYNVAITPAFDESIAINGLQAEFMYRANGTSDKLIVGVMTDFTDINTFEPVDTILPGTPATGWELRTVNFSNYEGNGHYIAFLNKNTTTTGYAYMDNLIIDLIPTCVKPQNVTITNITTEGCDVSWTPEGEETMWEVVAVEHNADVNTGTPETAYSFPFTLQGLLDDTQYDVYVRANCGGGDYSSWTFRQVFTTNPLCTSPRDLEVSQIGGTSALVSWTFAEFGATSYTVSYSEAGMENWISDVVTGTQYMLSGLDPNTEYNVSVLSNCDEGSANAVTTSFTTNCMAGGDPFTEGTVSTYNIPVNNFYRYTYSQQIFLASEINGATSIDSIAFYYNYATATSSKTNVTIYLGHTTQSTFSSTSNYIPSTNLQQVYSGNLNCTQGWNTFVFSTPFQYNGTDNLVLVVDDNSNDYDGNAYVFRAHNAGANRTVYYYSDSNNPDPTNPTAVSTSSSTSSNRSDVKFFIPCDNTVTCMAPNLYIDEVTNETITVDWAPGYAETSWELEYCSDTANWISMGTVNTHPYEISNLTSDTKYIIRVRSNCGAGETSAWAIVEGRTACDVVGIPYTEDFDDAPGSGAGNMVTCWTTGTNYTTAYPYTSSTYHNSGNFSAYFYGTSAYYSYLASPEFEEGVDMTNLQVRFWAYKTSAAYYIQVGVMTDPNDPNTFVQIGQNLTPSATSTWEMLEANTDSYTGEGRYIAFRIPAVATNYMYVDDITVDLIPVCLHVENIHTTSTTTTSANIAWTAGDDETDWVVVYGPTGSILDPEEETPIMVSGTPEIELTDLSPSSGYDVFVKAVCSPTESSIWWQGSFRTECGEIVTLPFVDNFDTYGTGSTIYPECWSKINTYSSDRPYINTTSYSSPGAMYFYAGTSGTYNIAVTPRFDASIPINTLQATFMYRGYSASDKLIVGVMTDSADASTFVPVETIVPDASYSTWVEREVNFNQYTGNGQFIAFKNAYTTTTAYAYVDNLSIDLIPACGKPRQIQFANITAEGADVDWLPNGEETSWEVVVVPAGQPVTSGTPELTSVHPFTLTDLDDETSYDVYVRAVCDAGEYSAWSVVATFTTTPLCSSPGAITVSQIAGTSALVTWGAAPYGAVDYTVEYTETGQGNWTPVVTTSATSCMLSGLDPVTSYTVRVSTNCADGAAAPVQASFTTNCLAGGELVIGNGTTTNYYLPVNNYYHYTYSQQIFLASEMNGPGEIHSVAFQYAYATPMSSKTNVTIYLGHTSQSTFSSTSDYIPVDSLTAVYTGSLNCTQGWNTFNFTAPFQYNGTDNLVLAVDDNSDAYNGSAYVFYVHSVGANRSLYFYSDSNNPDPTNPTTVTTNSSYSSGNRSNVKFGMDCDDNVPCVAPNAYASEVTAESITIDWAPGYTENAWDLEFSTDETTWTAVGTATAPYVFDNLNPDTRYYFRIRSNCGAEQSNWVTFSVRTECSDINVPYLQNFDDAPASGSGNMVTCWTRNSNYTTTAYPYTSSSQHHSGGYSVYFYGTSTYYSYIASPRLADEVEMNNLQISFWAYKTSAAYSIQVGVMTDPDDYSTFVQIGQDITPSTNSTWEMFEVNTNTYLGNGRYIAFRVPAVTTSYMYIDDINIDNIPTCTHVTGIHTTGVITPSSATVEWTPGGSESEWEVVYGPSGTITNPESETPETVFNNSITLDNLTGNTAYDVYVRAICGTAEGSTWMSYSFRTACEEVTVLPYTDDFDTYGTGTTVYPPCWYKINTYTSGDRPYIYSGGYSAPGSMYFYTGTSGTYNIAITPLFDASIAINTLQATFMYKASGSNDRLIVGVMESPTDASTFVPVDTVYPASTASTWVEKEVVFSQYTGNGQYIAFKNEYTTTTAYGYIDDLTIDLIPSCPKPHDLTVMDATLTEIELGWTEVGSATSWEIAYGAPGFDPDGSDAAYVTANTNPFTVQNLNNSTTYDFYVRALCGSTDMSPWSNKTSASTTMVPVDLPYTADFTDPADAWVLNNGNCTNYWVKGTLDNEGALFVTDNGTTPNYTLTSISVVSAQKLFTVGTNDSITITFDVEVKGEGSFDYMKLFLAPASAQFPATTTVPTGTYGINSYSTNAYDFYNNGYGTQSSYPYIMNMATGTVHVVAKMPNPNATPTATSTALLVFAWKNDSSLGTEPPATITNLTVTADGSGPGPVITDPSVTTVAATAVGQTNATLNATITNPDNVTISAKGFEWKTTTGGTYTQIAGTGTGNSFTADLTTLTPGTSYTFKAFITYNGNNYYGDEMTFTTQQQGQPTEPTATTADATNVTYNSATLNGSVANPDNVTITAQGFQWKVTNGGTYASVNATGATMTYNLTGLDASTGYTFRAFVTTANGTQYGQEKTFTTDAAPVEPCDVPTGLTVTDVQSESISVTWDNAPALRWNLQYGPVGGTLASATAYTNSYTFTNLNPLTTYQIRVQAVCEEGNESEWSSSIEATTTNLNSYLESNVTLYPNPAKEFVDVRVDGDVNVIGMEVYDVYGKLINTVNVIDNLTRINVSGLANGMYFVRVTTEQGVVTKRFVKR